MSVNYKRTNSRRDLVRVGRFVNVLSVSVCLPAAVAVSHRCISRSVRPHHCHLGFSVDRLRNDSLQFRRFLQQPTRKLLHLL